MGVNLREVLELPCFESAFVVAGNEGLNRPVTWVHVIDIPHPQLWARPKQLVLTTGYAWPREEAAITSLLRVFTQSEVSGIVLAVPQFFEHFPSCVRAEANKLGVPLIEVPWEVPFAQITESVHTVLLAEQSQVLERLDTLHRALTQAAAEATSLEAIVLTLGQLIGRTVVVIGIDANILAAHQRQDRRTPDAHASLPVEAGALVADLQKCGNHSQASHTMQLTPGLAQERPQGIICPIVLSGERVGYIWIVGDNEGFTPLDRRAAEHAAVVAALHLSRQRELAFLETRIRWSFLDALLEGRFEATAQALERAQMLGFNPRGAYNVGLLVMDVAVPLSRRAFNERERHALRLRDLLNSNGIPALITVSLNKLAFLIPEASAIEAIWKAVKQENLAMIVSPAHSGLEGIKQGFQEVQSVVPYLAPGQLRFYDDLVLPRVLQGDAAAQDAFVQSVIAPLEGARNGAKLVATLYALARAGFQLNKTADSLCIHISTLRHRLERVETLTGLNLNDAHIRFRIQLACEIAYLKTNK